MMVWLRYFSFVPILLVSACSSPTVRYHTLASADIGVQPVKPPAAFLISVLPVGVPPQLDQTPLVVRQGASGALVLDNDRWLSPFSEEIRTALATALVNRLNTQDVSGLAERTGAQPVLRVHLQVRRFDAWPGQKVMFAGDWSLSALDAGHRVQLLCTSHFTQRAPGGYEEMLQAQQKIIVRLAEQIAINADRWAQGYRADCV